MKAIDLALNKQNQIAPLLGVNSGCVSMYVKFFRPSFEVVKEGRILYFKLQEVLFFFKNIQT